MKKDKLQTFDKALEQVPPHVRGPLVNVHDTVKMMRLTAREHFGTEDPDLVLRLTALVLEESRRD